MSPSHHVVPGRRPVAEALRAGRRIDELVLAGEDGLLGELATAARAAGISVRTAARHELDSLAGGVAHQGAVAVGDLPKPGQLDDLAAGDLVVMLDGITDPQNFGAIARSAEAAGATGLVVPKRRSAAVTPAAEKAAAGALSWLPVATVPNLVAALRTLAEAGLWSVGLDADAGVAVWDCDLLDGRVVLVVGAEDKGLARLVRERVDVLAAIPLSGRVASLNASAAAAIALGEVLRRKRTNLRG